MALDFSQYARSYAGADPRGAGASVGGAIGSAIPRVEDKISMAKNDILGMAFEPLYDFLKNPVEQWGELDNIPSAGTAFMNWKTSLTPRQARIAKRNNLLNPIEFKHLYDTQLAMFAPEMKQKLESYRMIGNKSVKSMRKLLGDKPGLNAFLLGITTPEELVTTYNYLQPTRTYKQWWQDKTKLGKVGTAAKPVVAGGLAVKAAKDIVARGPMARYSPIGKKITSKDLKSISGGLTKTAEQVGMGKGKAGLKTISDYTKKHGVKGLVKLVGKKAGAKGIAKLLGKGILSLGLKSTGIGALASLGMDIATVLWIKNMIQGEE